MVILPFSRPDGDAIRLWVIDHGDSFEITDEGDTYGMLHLSGIDVDADSREKRIGAIKQRYKLDKAKYEITKKANADQLGKTLLEVYEAVQHVASLEHTRRPYPQDDFRSLVAGYLDDEGFSYEPNATVEGYAEPQTIDFSFYNLPQPTYMQAIRANDGTELHRKCEDASYRYIQIKRVQENSRFVSVVDDDRGTYDKSQMNPLYADSDAVVQWKQRGRLPSTLQVQA